MILLDKLSLNEQYWMFAYVGDFQRVCLEGGENVRLVVVSFRPSLGEEDTTENVEALISSLQLDYPQTPMTVLQVCFKFSIFFFF